MGIFKNIAAVFDKLRGRKQDGGVNKNDILSLIDNNLVLLRTVINTVSENADLLTYVRNNLLRSTGTDAENAALYALYDQYVKALSPMGRRLEADALLSSIYQTALAAITDHEKLRDNFASLFNQGTDAAQVQMEQLKLTHAAIFGYINLTSLMCDWFCFFVGGIIGQPDEALRTPAYRDQIIRTSAGTVASFVNGVLARGSTKSIIDVISDIRSKGDLVMYSESAALDTYANINDYPSAMQFFGSFQPIMFFHDRLTMWAYNKYKRNQVMRDWLITKVAVLRMDMANVDPNSAEYQKKLAMLNKYSAYIAELDKKISAYEKS